MANRLTRKTAATKTCKDEESTTPMTTRSKYFIGKFLPPQKKII